MTELFGIAATAVLFGLFGYMATRKGWRFDGCGESGECGNCQGSCSPMDGESVLGGGKAAGWWPVDEVWHGDKP